MAERPEAMWLHAQQRITIVELAEFSGVQQEVLRELVESGVLTPADAATGEFTAACVGCVRTAARLCNDLELEAPALPLVLALLERIDGLEARVRELDAQLGRPRQLQAP
jgi:hypothetical protein